jgi:uncharacterized protein
MDIAEERRLTVGAATWRAADDPARSPGVISAHAIVFDSMSEDLGGFVERVAHSSIEGADTDRAVCAFNHDPNMVVGAVGANLTLDAELAGLRYTCVLPMTTAGSDLAVNVREGIVKGSSFGFRLAPGGDSWSLTDDGRPLHTLTKIARLYDASPVVWPAYRGTQDDGSAVTLAHRSLAAWAGVEVDEVRSLAASGHLAELVRVRPVPVDTTGALELIRQRRDLLDRAARSPQEG